MSQNPVTTVEFRKLAPNIAIQRALKMALTHITPAAEYRLDRYRLIMLLGFYKAAYLDKEGRLPYDKPFVEFTCDLLVDAAEDYEDKGTRFNSRLEKLLEQTVEDNLQRQRIILNIQAKRYLRAED